MIYYIWENLKDEFYKITVPVYIGGFVRNRRGYLIWLWLKENKSFWYGITGAIVLIMYGVVATLQTANFGRGYATYGGIFIVMALLWAWKVDGFKPDKYDIIGAAIALFGACMIIYMPRK